MLQDSGRLKEAESPHREALSLRRRLVDQFPRIPEYRNLLAISHNNLGNALLDLGRPEEAEKSYRDALALRQRLATEFPNMPEYRRQLARAYTCLANLLRNTGRLEEALAPYRDALSLRQQLAEDFPLMTDYENELAETIGDFAKLLRARKEPQSARRLFEEALGDYRAVLKVNPRHPDYRRFFRNDLQALAETLIDLGEHAAAANMAAELIRAAVDPANDFYNAACVLSLCIPLAERDAQSLAGSYGERALATLRQAVQQGFKDWKHMKKDKDLDPLRSREEFQKLVAELEGSNQRLQVP